MFEIFSIEVKIQLNTYYIACFKRLCLKNERSVELDRILQIHRDILPVNSSASTFIFNLEGRNFLFTRPLFLRQRKLVK